VTTGGCGKGGSTSPGKPWAGKCSCGYDRIDPDLVKRLNLARELAGVPFEINSACRYERHNAAEGGKPGSAHTTGEAVDIKVHNNKHRYFVLVGLSGAGFKRVGPGSNFIGRFPLIFGTGPRYHSTKWQYLFLSTGPEADFGFVKRFGSHFPSSGSGFSNHQG
jgi:hypothetical protein